MDDILESNITNLDMAISDGDKSAAAVMIEHIWRIGPMSSESLPTLVNVIDAETDAGLQWRSIEAIREIGIFTSQVIAALKHAALSNNFYVHWHAMEVLFEAIGPEELVPVLAQCLGSNSNAYARVLVAEKVHHFGILKAELVTALLAALRGDQDRDVRVASAKSLEPACRNFANVPHALTEACADPDPHVRFQAAYALVRLGQFSPKIIELVRSAFQHEDLFLDGWNAFEALRANGIFGANDLQAFIPESVLEALIPEIIAQGVLPTIGLKAWQKDFPIQIPAHKDPTEDYYPWKDHGVSHHWATHARRLNTSETELQICIHSDWLSGVHLIALLQFILHPQNMPLIVRAPVQIEGLEFGFIIQSGGILKELERMRYLSPPYKTQRIDFVHGYTKNLQAVQCLMFAALSFRNPPAGTRDLLGINGVTIWERFTSLWREILSSEGLSNLLANEWYLDEGWRSIRYRKRYERSYDHSALFLEQLRHRLNSGTSRLCDEIDEFIVPLITQFEESLWFQRRSCLPADLAHVVDRVYDGVRGYSRLGRLGCK